MTLTPRELSTLLAALRMWSGRNIPPWWVDDDARAELEVIAKANGPALDAEEIDQLAAKLQSQMPK